VPRRSAVQQHNPISTRLTWDFWVFADPSSMSAVPLSALSYYETSCSAKRLDRVTHICVLRVKTVLNPRQLVASARPARAPNTGAKSLEYSEVT
jgi:hypothetical protein